MSLLSTQPNKSRSPRLSREDWLVDALAVLVSRGVDAVQITHLARRLGVTRGSFYWHFENREALLDALLAEWRARNSDVMLSALANAESLQDGILALFNVWVDHKRFDPALDQAVRDWARHAGEVRAIVAAEDDARVEAIARFFARHGYLEAEAFIRGRVIYFTQLSYYALGIAEPIDTRLGYLSAYFLTFTGRELDADAAQRFRQRQQGERV